MRSLLMLLLAFVASTQALILQTAGHLGLSRAAASAANPEWARADSCPCMACRTNLKKEKRVRNRVNAFRFKKGGFTKRRFNNGPDYAAEQKKADEDNAYFAMVFTYSAEE